MRVEESWALVGDGRRPDEETGEHVVGAAGVAEDDKL
jgi:hypothetical protein